MQLIRCKYNKNPNNKAFSALYSSPKSSQSKDCCGFDSSQALKTLFLFEFLVLDLFQKFSDVAAGVRIDVGGLGGNHAGAADGVFAEEESLTDLLADVGGGVREAMVVEEQGVHRFAARNRRGVDDRDALRSGLGAVVRVE